MWETEYQLLKGDLFDKDPVTRILGINQIIAYTEAHMEYKAETIRLLNALLQDPDEDVRITASDSVKYLIGDQPMQDSHLFSPDCPFFAQGVCTEKEMQGEMDRVCREPIFLNCKTHQIKSQEELARSKEEKKREEGWIISCCVIAMIVIMILWRFMTGY